MQRSKVEIYLHLVWATYRRLPLIRPDIEALVHDQIAGEAQRHGCEVLAVNGMADHVHLAAKLPAPLSVAKLMQQVKGVSSTRMRRQLTPGETFGWQDHYAAFSFSRSHLDRVVAYIHNQKRHHAAGTIWTPWEQTGEPPPGP